MEGVEYLKTYGWRAAHIVYENAKLRNENKLKNWFIGECELL